tara:strand:+ start:103 stop:348 length:246 start_codon:yes stop_codon:yes gene_type:complete
MKITKNQLKQLIKEAIGIVKGQEWVDEYADAIKRIVKLAEADGHDVTGVISKINILATTVKRAGTDLPPASSVATTGMREQ